MTMESNDLLRDILIHTDTGKLKQFVNEYANDHADFRDVFLEKFSPKPKPKPGSKHKQPEEDYPRIIKKARYYLRHDNREEAIHIAQNLIDTIPDYWDENFDYEGDVQVIYDEAIDLLEDILNDEPTTEQMELIFSWYEKVNGDKKHQYMGLNSSLEQLERYFAADAVGGFERVLRIVDKRIAISEEYEKQRAVVEKIYLLEENNREAAADQTIEQYLFFPDVRAIRLKRLLTAERYDDAIRLLQEGIEIAKEKKTMGTVNEWRKELFSIYLQYVQQQATITDKEAYKRVGQTLIWMKSFEGGTAVVRQLINQFRETYKRRPYMMKELDRVF